MKKEELRDQYLREAEESRTRAAKEESVLLLISVLRLVCFLAGLSLVVFLAANHEPVPAFVSALVFIVAFLFLLSAYSQHSYNKELASNLASINQNEAEALSGDLSKFRDGGRFINNQHEFSYDIDLFGRDSLFQYLNRTVTAYGEETLAGWLSDPFALSPELHRRQEIIRELSDHRSLRQHFMAAGMKVPVDRDHATDLVMWLKGKNAFSPARSILIFLLPALTIIALLLLAAGALHYSVAVVLVLVNLGYVSSGLKDTNAIHRMVSGKYEWLSSLSGLLTVFGKERFVSPFLSAMQDELSGEDFSAAASVRKLGKIIQRFDSRLNMIAGFTLNGLLLWDYHCIRKLEQWKTENREKFTGWLQLTAEIDAYSSLANYAYNNGDYAWPAISEKGAVIEATGLGHPLIPEEKRICNDFSVPGAGKICIITGANMAGKSTFLRTVAANLILAMSGSPVCAASFEFKPVKLFTSMRTTDSLSGNESYFYAELKRLRALRTEITGDKSVFFILDEILKGTNSADKALGSKLFLEKLITMGSAGMIATHDISLADLEKSHPGSVLNMCFEIEIDGEKISFDYKLREGITRKMNAALLMRQMGILD
jgi:hypothetical protein